MKKFNKTLWLMLIVLLSSVASTAQGDGVSDCNQPMFQAARAATPAGLTTLTGQPTLGAVANGRIAFVGAADIYTMNPDGSDQRQLTFSPPDHYTLGPVWSPDGTRLAFQKTYRFNLQNQFQQAEIFVMDADGSNQRRLSPAGEFDYLPAWSPDGTQIAFVRNILEGKIHHNQIFVMDADGSNPRRLTHAAGMDGALAWSPDGTKLAFLRQIEFTAYLVVVNADGSGERTLGQSRIPPAWSPDGSKLAFASYDESGIYVMNADGSNPTQVTRPANDAFNIEFDTSPAWSPDGSKLTFSRNLGCDVEGTNCFGAQIHVVNADGSNLSNSNGDGLGGFAYQPIWSPDGTDIIFLGGTDLFVMNAEGGGLTNLTHTRDESEFAPAWQPLHLVSCADALASAGQSFEVEGGTGSIEVTAGSECHWTATSNFGWIRITAGDHSGNGSVPYAVAANPGTHSRSATILIAAQVFTITQVGAAVRITGATVAGKTLVVAGERFDPGAVILLNGEAQNTRNDAENPTATLIGKKAGKKIRVGDKLQVRNPDGLRSQEFTFSGS